MFVQTGVISKIQQQLDSMGNFNNILPIGFNTTVTNKNSIIKNCQFIYPFFNTNYQFLNKLLSSRQLFKVLKKEKPDIIYLRQSIWTPFYFKMFRKYNCVVEINSLDKNELKYYKIYKRLWYLLGRNWILKKAKGLVTVSSEIEKSVREHNDNIIVNSNGINYNEYIKNYSNERINNDRPQLIFMGSLSQKWQGVEKVFYMAKKLGEFDFHCVGFEKGQLNLPKLNNLFIYERLTKFELDELMCKMDIGIGTLSLYEKKMNEASPLKVRQYLEHRMYLIVGYLDTDLSKNDDGFHLQLPNEINNIEEYIENIRNFIWCNYNKRIDTNLYKYSVEFKDKIKIEFFKSLLN